MEEELYWYQWLCETDIYVVVARTTEEALAGLLKLLHDENDQDYIVHANSPNSYLIRQKYEDDPEDEVDPDDDEDEYDEYHLSNQGPFIVGYPLYLGYL